MARSKEQARKGKQKKKLSQGQQQEQQSSSSPSAQGGEGANGQGQNGGPIKEEKQGCPNFSKKCPIFLKKHRKVCKKNFPKILKFSQTASKYLGY
jgi:hypothetical protein